LLPVNEDAATLTAILYPKAFGCCRDRHALTRDARIVQGQVVSLIAPASDEERQLADANYLPRPVRKHDLEMGISSSS